MAFGYPTLGINVGENRYTIRNKKNGCSTLAVHGFYCKMNHDKSKLMNITTTGNLGPVILHSLAPSMLYTPTPGMNNILVCDKATMPSNGGTTMRFLRARALKPATVQLGNSGIDPAPQVPQRDIIDAQMAVFGTGCVLNEQVIEQDQDGVLAWVSDRLAVSMRQGRRFALNKFSLIDLELLAA